MTSTSGTRSLLVVCLNPPSESSGNRTLHAVAAASRALGCQVGKVANLCTAPTASVVELNGRLTRPSDWIDHRDSLRRELEAASVIVGAWGISGLTGEARRIRDDQVTWLFAAAGAAGHRHIWLVGGEARHPSRWHQYVADKHGRTSGGSLEQRLLDVMHPRRLT